MTAKSDIAVYSISTRFGGRKPIKHHRRETRPQTRGEALRQIEVTYRYNGWLTIERAANHRRLGFEVKPQLGDYTNEELKIILDDLEKFSMILYEE